MLATRVQFAIWFDREISFKKGFTENRAPASRLSRFILREVKRCTRHREKKAGTDFSEAKSS